MMKFLSPLGRGFKDGLKEEPSTKWQFWVIVIMVACWVVTWSYPHPPADADFLYSLGWYSSHAFATVGNLFR